MIVPSSLPDEGTATEAYAGFGKVSFSNDAKPGDLPDRAPLSEDKAGSTAHGSGTATCVPTEVPPQEAQA
jgi:hypothetical protein